MNPEMIEKAARAIRATDGANVGWEGLGESTKTTYRDYARAVIAAIHPTVTSEAGYEALSHGSAIIDSYGDVGQKLGTMWHFPETAPMDSHRAAKSAPATVISMGGAA